jgi:hypothetical protein
MSYKTYQFHMHAAAISACITGFLQNGEQHIIFSYHCHHGITPRVCDLALRTPFATLMHYYSVEDTIQMNKIKSSKCLASPLAV